MPIEIAQTNSENKNFVSPRDQIPSSSASRNNDKITGMRDRARITATPSDRREKLGAVGRVASRVRTSGRIRISSAFGGKGREGEDDTDVDESPWGVGTSVNATPGNVPEQTTANMLANTSAVSVVAVSEVDPTSPGSAQTALSPPRAAPTHRPDLPVDISSPVSVESGSTASGMRVTGLESVRRDVRGDRPRPGASPIGTSNFSGASKVAALPPDFATSQSILRGKSSPIILGKQTTFSSSEGEKTDQERTDREKTHNVMAKKVSRVMFRLGTQASSPAHSNNEEKPSTSANAGYGNKEESKSPVTGGDKEGENVPTSSEKSTFRTFITSLREKGKNDVITTKVRGVQEKKRSGLGRSISVAVVGSSSLLPASNVPQIENGGEEHNKQTGRPSAGPNAVRKSRTWRRKDRDDTKEQDKGRIGQLLNILSGAVMDKPERTHGHPPKSLNEQDDKQSGTSSSPEKEDMRKRGKDKDVSELDFADDEFYDSDDDDEPSADRGDSVVPSLARDDFVAYQTSQKRKAQKPRVSLMRM